MSGQQGEWDYAAGVSGTRTLTKGSRVLQITAISTTAAGSFTINGGDVIPLPQNVSLSICPLGNLFGPTVIFTSTDSYFMEFVK